MRADFTINLPFRNRRSGTPSRIRSALALLNLLSTSKFLYNFFMKNVMVFVSLFAPLDSHCGRFTATSSEYESEGESDISTSNAGSWYKTLFLSDSWDWLLGRTPMTDSMSDSQSFIITVFIQNHEERIDALNQNVQIDMRHCFIVFIWLREDLSATLPRTFHDQESRGFWRVLS